MILDLILQLLGRNICNKMEIKTLKAQTHAEYLERDANKLKNEFIRTKQDNEHICFEEMLKIYSFRNIGTQMYRYIRHKLYNSLTSN